MSRFGLRAAMHGVERREKNAAVEDPRWARVREREPIYEAVFSEWPATRGKVISKRERDAEGLYASSLVYGEIAYSSFGTTLEKIRAIYGAPGVGASGDAGVMQRPGCDVFYDLGSGAGKPAIAAATLWPFSSCVGVEYLSGLVAASLDAKLRYEEIGRPLLAACGECSPAVEFVCADVTDLTVHDWSQADVVFANSTCFDEALLNAVAAQAAKLKKGAFFVTLTKRLPSKHFALCESELYQMSWGGATVFIQQKTTDRDDSLAAPAGPDSRAWTRRDPARPETDDAAPDLTMPPPVSAKPEA